MTRTKILVALVGGAAIGVAVGLLLAPDKGSNTREYLKEQASDIADKILTLADQILAEVEKRARHEEAEV
jgi:gas vesicle protein